MLWWRNVRRPFSSGKRASARFRHEKGRRCIFAQKGYREYRIRAERGECHVAVFWGGRAPFAKGSPPPRPPKTFTGFWQSATRFLFERWDVGGSARQASCHCRMYLPYVCVGAGLQRWLLFWLFLEQAVRMRRTDCGRSKKPDRSAALSFAALMKLAARTFFSALCHAASFCSGDCCTQG